MAAWTWATTWGELVGFTLVGVLAVPLFLAGREPGVPLLLAFSVAAALVEGSVLAFAQWRVLRRELGVRYRAWAVATVLPAAFAYAAGMTGGPALGQSSLPAAAKVGLAVAMALALGALLGAGQWLVLRRRATRTGAWVPASALGWCGGLALSVAGVSVSSDLGSLVATIAVVALSGVAMGAFVGLVTGVALARLVPRPDVSAGGLPAAGAPRARASR